MLTVKSGYRKPPIGHFKNSIHSTPVIIDDFVIAFEAFEAVVEELTGE